MEYVFYISEAKKQAETVSYFGDFRDMLFVGETITSQSVNIQVITGFDSNPSSMLYGGISVHNGNVIEQRVKLGVVGCIYDIIFTVGTNQSNEYVKATRLAILPDNWGVSPQHTVYYYTSTLYPYEYPTEGLQSGVFTRSDGNFWYQPSFKDSIQESIVITSGNLYVGSISYACPPESIQEYISITGGSFTIAAIYYNITGDAIKMGIAILNGNLFNSAVNYTYPAESIQSFIAVTGGTLA